VIVLDTSVVLAFMDRGDEAHAAVRGWLQSTDEDLVTTPLALAEMDHLVSRYGGRRAAEALYDEVASGAYQVEWWPEALAQTIASARGRADLGLTDASLVALASHLGTTLLATLDERHFRTVGPLSGEAALTLLPADAPKSPR
jgi:uncharacterized protein